MFRFERIGEDPFPIAPSLALPLHPPYLILFDDKQLLSPTRETKFLV